MIEIGQEVIFNPIRDTSCFGGRTYFNDIRVTGVITEIHASHSWFMVEYGTEYRIRTCFKFNDIGESVVLVKKGVTNET